MSALMQATVVRLRAGERGGGFDPHGDSDGWDSASREQIDRCSIQPGAPQPELLGNRDTTGVVWTVYIEGPADVRANDRVELPGGLVYEIDGEPQRWPQGLALPPLTVVMLRRWEEIHG